MGATLRPIIAAISCNPVFNLASLVFVEKGVLPTHHCIVEEHVVVRVIAFGHEWRQLIFDFLFFLVLPECLNLFV